MRYELIAEEDGIKIYARIDDDGLRRVTCSEENPEYQTWLAEQSAPVLEEVPVESAPEVPLNQE